MINRRVSSKNDSPLLLLVGAGETEVGHWVSNASTSRGRTGGVLPPLLERILDHCAGYMWDAGIWNYRVSDARKFDDLMHIPVSRPSGKLTSKDETKVKYALFLAEQKGLDGVIILIDQESKNQPDRAARLRKGRDEYRRKVADAKSPSCAVAAACRSVETWLLADPNAIRRVFGAIASPFFGDPEERPKPEVLKKYIESAAKEQGLRPQAACAELARIASPAELVKRCPTSYAPFLSEVRTEIHPLF